MIRPCSRKNATPLILKMVEGRDAVSYDDLVAVVDASGATIRRDVDQLCEAGRIRKVRGGIAPVLSANIRPAAVLLLRRTASDQRPGQGCHRPGGADAGGAAGHAHSLRQAPRWRGWPSNLPASGMTVLTDSLPVANHMMLNTANRVFMTGGEVLCPAGHRAEPRSTTARSSTLPPAPSSSAATP